MADKGLQPIPAGLSQDDFLAAVNDRLKRISNLLSNVTPTNSIQINRANADLTLTTAAQNVPGANVVLSKSGRYLILGVFDFLATGAGDVGSLFSGSLSASGAIQTGTATFVPETAGQRGTVAQNWFYTAPATGKTAQLQVVKSAGTGTSAAKAANSTIIALWLGSN